MNGPERTYDLVHAVGLEVAELDADERHCEKLNAVRDGPGV